MPPNYFIPDEFTCLAAEFFSAADNKFRILIFLTLPLTVCYLKSYFKK